MESETMSNCPTCGLRLRRASDGLFICDICGFRYKPNQSTPLLSGYVSKAVVIQVPDADKDLDIFISRVAERLAPTEGLDPQGSARALRVQRQFRRELTNVFSGKQNFDEWFNKTAVNLGLHTLTFIEILRQCLEGLQSQEVKKLRIEYDEYLNKLQRAYTPR